MNLKKLIKEIVKEKKIPAEELVLLLSDGIEEDPASFFMELYIKAYGHHLSCDTVSEWVDTVGEKWSLNETTEIGNYFKVNWNLINKYEFYAVMNDFHKNFQKTASKFNLEDNPEFFAGLVRDYFSHDKTVFDYYFSYSA